ncbi:unnamed protein product [Dibothriocephalus latus]|uniref:Uncharacterized protein n=1 Tax=Dibothriocephalus latus TaxID=60516 RepID=A0A3P7MAK1_DIBLA|nr:unnamed protein product [Dibothriocephalus latus]
MLTHRNIPFLFSRILNHFVLKKAPRDGGKNENRYRIRLTSSTTFQSMPDVFSASSSRKETRFGSEEDFRAGRSLPIIPSDSGSRQERQPTTQASKLADADASQFNKEYETEKRPEMDRWRITHFRGPIPKSRSSLSLFDSTKSYSQKPPYHPRLPLVDAEDPRLEGVCTNRSLPNLFDLSITHESSTMVEKFRLFQDDASVSCGSFNRLLTSSPSAQPSPIHRLTAGDRRIPSKQSLSSIPIHKTTSM